MRREMFERRHRVRAQIPSVSMGDIAFLLLIFFMATTIFRSDPGIEVRLPQAETSEKHEKDQVLHVWIDQNGRVWINNRFVATNRLHDSVVQETAVKPGLVVAFNADVRAPYRAVADVLEELKQANATRVSFTSEPREHPARP
jgi:biopolymer transport protein ExbD